MIGLFCIVSALALRQKGFAAAGNSSTSNCIQACNFSLNDVGRNDSSKLTIKYDVLSFLCYDCEPSGRKILMRVERNKKLGEDLSKICEISNCNGALSTNLTCTPAHFLKQEQFITKKCKGLKLGRKFTFDVEHREEVLYTNQVPLIIGFAIGGIMLAVVVGGIFVGRSQTSRTAASDEVMTTPVSMSYSDWISNHTTGQRGSKTSNMHIHESPFHLQEHDENSVPVYNIVYDENISSSHEHAIDTATPIVIEVDDEGSQKYAQCSATTSLDAFQLNPQLDERNKLAKGQKSFYTEASGLENQLSSTKNLPDVLSKSTVLCSNMTKHVDSCSSSWSDESEQEQGVQFSPPTIISNENDLPVDNHIDSKPNVKCVFVDVHNNSTNNNVKYTYKDQKS
uniref:Uncharacterized protein LOC100179717 n=1 Tax=Phallusia mammillata TaxID=59560 RepID=A0A6F9DGE2_9ASCI|nr:uncharacterized protein LOC100179717 [Phallusia mammillata]